jgi:hypothetical protein
MKLDGLARGPDDHLFRRFAATPSAARSWWPIRREGVKTVRNESRSIPEPEENRNQAMATTYACEIFL